MSKSPFPWNNPDYLNKPLKEQIDKLKAENERLVNYLAVSREASKVLREDLEQAERRLSTAMRVVEAALRWWQIREKVHTEASEARLQADWDLECRFWITVKAFDQQREESSEAP